MKDRDITRLTLECGDKTASWELNRWDVNMYDLVEAFVGLCVTQTFHPDTVVQGMKTYIEEHESN